LYDGLLIAVLQGYYSLEMLQLEIISTGALGDRNPLQRSKSQEWLNMPPKDQWQASVGPPFLRKKSETERGIVLWEYCEGDSATWIQYADEECATIESMYGRGSTQVELSIEGSQMGFDLGAMKMRDLSNGEEYPVRRKVFQSQDMPSESSTTTPEEDTTPYFDLGIKFKDGWLWKYAGGYRNSSRVQYAFNWTRRWFVVKEHYLAYYKDPHDDEPQGILLFDKSMQVEMNSDLKFTLTCEYRTLSLCGESAADVRGWFDALSCIVQDYVDTALMYRFGSYAPLRQSMGARWFVDGSSYFAALKDVLKAAQYEILITGWFISPELILARDKDRPYDSPEADEDRLDRILAKKAAEGVVVRVLIFKEWEGVMGNSSAHAEAVLTNAHPKIQVIRHARQSVLGAAWWGGESTSWWSHHEKVVVVDQDVAFAGGLDTVY